MIYAMILAGLDTSTPGSGGNLSNGVNKTPSRQQADNLVLVDGFGAAAVLPTPILSPHQPAMTVPPNTAKGTTGTGILFGTSTH